MVKVGFICEGESERIIVESAAFQDLLKRLQIECIFPVIDAVGNKNLLPKNIQTHLNTLKTAGAEKFVILTDLDLDACITITKERITPIENAVVIIAVKQLEAWFLADKAAISNLLKQNYFEADPESFEIPIKRISELTIQYTNRGLGNSKPFIAKKLLKAGFTIENAAQHPKCQSALYFLNKLTELSTSQLVI